MASGMISKRFGLLTALAGTAAVLGFCAPAQATTVTVSNVAQNWGSVSVGIVDKLFAPAGGSVNSQTNMNAGAIALSVPTSFVASGVIQSYCIDIFHYTATPTTYTVGTLASSPEQSAPNATTSWSTTQVNMITALLQNGALQTQNAINTAALQVAIWEVEYGTAASSYSLSSLTNTSQNFYFTTTSDTNSTAVLTQAAQELTYAANGTWALSNATIAYELNNGSGVQDQVYLNTVASGGGNNPAPEPATIGILGLGLAGLWAARRKQASA